MSTRADGRAVLIADLFEPANFIKQSLKERFSFLQSVQTFESAVDALSSHRFDLIIAGVHFDESRMIEFLWYVKGLPKYKEVPFICVRLLSSHPEITSNVRAAHRLLGAAAFIEVHNMDASGEKVIQEGIDAAMLGYS